MQRKFWQGHQNCSNLAKAITKATTLQKALARKNSVKDIPWSYEFWYYFLSPSIDRDPDDPATWNPTVEVWPGIARRRQRAPQSESDQEDEDWGQASAEFLPDTEQDFPQAGRQLGPP